MILADLPGQLPNIRELRAVNSSCLGDSSPWSRHYGSLESAGALKIRVAAAKLPLVSGPLLID